MAADPPHIVKAKQLLSQRATVATLKPLGVVTVADILDAERSLAAAQAELRDYQAGTDGMRETLDRSGAKGLVVEQGRFEKLSRLESRVNARRLELAHTKRAWLGRED